MTAGDLKAGGSGSMLDAEACWRAVQDRDPAADGSFVYGVGSTKIYCRPTCPARRPARGQVRFFPDTAAASRAGFRPCLRCRPAEVAADAARAQQVCRYIEAHLEESLDLETLGGLVGLSGAHLQRLFRRAAGVSPRQYADACRLARFKTRLREGEGVTGALYDAGYGSSSRLYERAPAQLGMTPGVYRKGGDGARIRYALADTHLGRLLVAATERGICVVSLGEDAALEEALRQEYPRAALERDDAALAEWVAALVRHLNGELPHVELPLDVRATAFQWRVWSALQAIPYGSTRTYGELALACGLPGGARAVGRACATNPVSLIVPCHRAVRSDGGLGGYRWGIDRKRELLAMESAGESHSTE